VPVDAPVTTASLLSGMCDLLHAGLEDDLDAAVFLVPNLIKVRAFFQRGGVGDHERRIDVADELRREGVNVEAVGADLAICAAWTSSTPSLTDGGWTPCWPMPGAGWERLSSIRTSPTFAVCSIPTLRARSISFTKSAMTCADRAQVAF
jgi:hypothetical protein